MTSISVKMADSGFYESSEASLQRQSPLPAGSTVAPSAPQGAGQLPRLSVSPVPPLDRWSPLSDDTSPDDLQPDHFGGGEVEQFEDGAPEVQDNSGLVVLLRAQCQAQERELTSLRSEKITESITQQMSALEESLAKTEELQEKVHYLNKDLATSKDTISQLEDKLANKEPVSPQRGGGGRPQSPTGSMYLPGRWTASRAYSKKHAEEMKLICAALEAEGYGPSQVSGDEVIRHLWWEKENMRKGSGKGGGTGKDAAENLPQLFQDYQEKVAALEETLQQLQEERVIRTEVAAETQDALKRELRERLTAQEEAERKLSTFQGRLAALEQDNTQMRTRARVAKTTIQEQANTMAKSAGDVARLERQSITLQAELQRERTQAAGVKSKLQSLQPQVDTLNTQLSDAQRDLAAKEHQLLLHADMVQEAARGRALHAEEITELKSEVEKLQVENNHLERESEDIGVQVEQLTRKAEELSQKLASRTTELKHIAEEYSAYKHEAECRCTDLQGQLHELETSLMAASSQLKQKDSAIDVLSAEAAGLKTQVTSLREELTRVSANLQRANNELEQKACALDREASSLQETKSKLELSEQVSNSLKHQLEVQRERAAAALNKIQKQYSEESGRLRQDKTSLEQETEQAKATLLHKERSLNAAMATKMELQMEIQRMSEERNEIKGELRKEAMNVTLLENKVKQLQHSVDMETHAKANLEEELQTLRGSHSKLEIELAAQREKCHGLTQVRSQLEAGIERERSQVARMRGELAEVEEHTRAVERQLQEERSEHHGEAKRLNKEAQEGRHMYQEEKAALKKQLKRLNKEVEMMRTQHDQLAATVNQLEADNVALTDANRLMAEAASERDTLMHELEEEARSLHTRNQDLEMEISQLKLEVETLYRSCLEFEEYKKRLDSHAKAEMQRVLSDVTRHMEQQYLAQKSLEKLRAENEAIAIRQKDRKIDHLRDELCRTKLDGRQDRLHLDSLELEAQLLRSQKKEMDRSRKKLEKRLEKVNTSLSQSLKSSFTDSMPSSYLTSTPRT